MENSCFSMIIYRLSICKCRGNFCVNKEKGENIYRKTIKKICFSILFVLMMEEGRGIYLRLAAKRIVSVSSASLWSWAISWSMLSYFSSGRVRFTKVSRINLS